MHSFFSRDHPDPASGIFHVVGILTRVCYPVGAQHHSNPGIVAGAEADSYTMRLRDNMNGYFVFYIICHQAES